MALSHAAVLPAAQAKAMELCRTRAGLEHGRLSLVWRGEVALGPDTRQVMATLPWRVICLTWRKLDVYLPSDFTGVLEDLSIKHLQGILLRLILSHITLNT